MMRSTSLRSNSATACATASQVLPVPAGPDAEHELVALERADVGVLAGGARAHRALAQVDLLERRARRRRIEIEQRALRDREADRAFDVALREIVAALDLLVEAFEHALGALAAVARAFERHLVAARGGHHAEAALDQREVLPVLAEQRRGAAIVVEGEHGLGGRGVVRLAGGGNERFQSAGCAIRSGSNELRMTGRRGILHRFAACPRARRTGCSFQVP